MTASVVLCGAVDMSTLGTCTYTLTDSTGTKAPFDLPTTGYKEPGTLIANAGVTSPSLGSLVGYLVGVMNAISPTKTYTGSWSQFTGKYTISVNSGTFSLACSGAGPSAALFGEATSISSGAGSTWTSTYVPKYVIVPKYPGLYNYIPPLRVSGATKERVTSSGKFGAQRPTTVPRVARWDHQFEPKYMVDNDASGSTPETQTNLYTWESLWTDYGLGRMPLGICIADSAGNYEQFAFSLMDRDFSEAVVKRRASNDDARFTVSVKARLWPTATANVSARAFNV